MSVNLQIQFFKEYGLLFVQCNEHNLNDLGKHAEILAEAEGLDAHKMSIYARRKDD